MLKTGTEIIMGSWELYAKNWKRFLPFVLMLFLPTVILSMLGIISLYLSYYLPSSSLASNLMILIVFAANFVFTIWVSVALAKIIFNCLAAKPTVWKETFLGSSNLIWPAIYTSFLVSLIVIGGTLLLIVPGIIFAVWYCFAFYAVILDGAKGLGALGASKSLVVGRWWPILWRLFIATLVFGFINYAIAYALTLLIKLLPLPIFIQSASVRVVVSLIGSVMAPLSAGATLILYKSAKENPVLPQPASAPPSQP